jgi:hypothetical protein
LCLDEAIVHYPAVSVVAVAVADVVVSIAAVVVVVVAVVGLPQLAVVADIAIDMVAVAVAVVPVAVAPVAVFVILAVAHAVVSRLFATSATAYPSTRRSWPARDLAHDSSPTQTTPLFVTSSL